MPLMSLSRSPGLMIGSFLAVCAVTAACAPASQRGGIPPAPVVGRWPDPAFLPEKQCRGSYAVDQLEPYLSRARLALWLPSTRAVALDKGRRCITVTVESVGGGRLAELVIRGMAVPRKAVLLVLAGSERRS
jgi:hypothetical protein